MEYYSGDEIYGREESNKNLVRSYVPIFMGSFDIGSLFDWIEAVEDFFEEWNPPKKLRCRLASYTFEGDAEIWWRRLQRSRVEHGEKKVTLWEEMRQIMFHTFLPTRRLIKGPIQNYKKGPSERDRYDSSAELYHPTITKATQNHVKNNENGKVVKQEKYNNVKPAMCSAKVHSQLLERETKTMESLHAVVTMPSNCSMKWPLEAYSSSQSENCEHKSGHGLCHPTPVKGTEAPTPTVAESILKQAEENEDDDFVPTMCSSEFCLESNINGHEEVVALQPLGASGLIYDNSGVGASEKSESSRSIREATTGNYQLKGESFVLQPLSLVNGYEKESKTEDALYKDTDLGIVEKLEAETPISRLPKTIGHHLDAVMKVIRVTKKEIFDFRKGETLIVKFDPGGKSQYDTNAVDERAENDELVASNLHLNNIFALELSTAASNFRILANSIGAKFSKNLLNAEESCVTGNAAFVFDPGDILYAVISVNVVVISLRSWGLETVVGDGLDPKDLDHEAFGIPLPSCWGFHHYLSYSNILSGNAYFAFKNAWKSVLYVVALIVDEMLMLNFDPGGNHQGRLSMSVRFSIWIAVTHSIVVRSQNLETLRHVALVVEYNSIYARNGGIWKWNRNDEHRQLASPSCLVIHSWWVENLCPHQCPNFGNCSGPSWSKESEEQQKLTSCLLERSSPVDMVKPFNVESDCLCWLSVYSYFDHFGKWCSQLNKDVKERQLDFMTSRINSSRLLSYEGLCHEVEFMNDGCQTMDFDAGGNYNINAGRMYMISQMDIRFVGNVKSVAATGVKRSMATIFTRREEDLYEFTLGENKEAPQLQFIVQSLYALQPVYFGPFIMSLFDLRGSLFSPRAQSTTNLETESVVLRTGCGMSSIADNKLLFLCFTGIAYTYDCRCNVERLSWGMINYNIPYRIIYMVNFANGTIFCCCTCIWHGSTLGRLLHLMRAIDEYWVQSLFIVENMYYGKVSVDGSSNGLTLFDIGTRDHMVFVSVIVVLDMDADITLQTFSIHDSGLEMCGSTLWGLFTRFIMGVVSFWGVEGISETNFSLMIMLVNDKPEEGSMYSGFLGKQVYAAHMKLANEAFRCLSIAVENVQYLKGDGWKEMVSPICEKRTDIGHLRLLSRTDGFEHLETERAGGSFETNLSCALEWRIKIYSEMFGAAWQCYLRMGIGLKFTRGRAFPLEGWNDVKDYNAEEWFIVMSSCKKDRFRPTSKMFYKVVNGLDPPTYMKVGWMASSWILLKVRSRTSFSERGME